MKGQRDFVVDPADRDPREVIAVEVSTIVGAFRPGGLHVVVRGDLEGALRRFRKARQASGLLRDLRRHEFFLGPSARRRLKAKAARAKRRKKLKEDQP